jgi:hypothetical protein
MFLPVPLLVLKMAKTVSCSLTVLGMWCVASSMVTAGSEKPAVSFVRVERMSYV